MKQQKSEVQYTDRAADHSERCGLCAHFVPLYNKCRKVDGKISAQGWCELFSREKQSGR